MILEYNGDKVDYFEIIFNDYLFKPWGIDELQPARKLGIWLSGGADSAFTFWYLANCIEENKLYDFSIIPIHGHDEARQLVDSRVPTLKIIEYIKNEFPNVNIQPPHIFSYYKDPWLEDKGPWHQAQQEYLRKNHIIDIVINCMTANPPVDEIDGALKGRRDPTRDKEARLKTWSIERHRPFELVNKKFLAHFYNEFGLAELFKMTVSCTAGYDADKEKIFPCRTCWWCLEKYWAFGMYDNGDARYKIVFNDGETEKVLRSEDEVRL
jgi:hypothetical protein